MDFLEACAVLARTPGLKAEKVQAWVAATGSLETAVIRNARGFDQKAVEADLRWVATSGAHLIPCTSAAYPPMLTCIPDAPSVLYVLGDFEVLSMPQLAIVGSRNPTAGGRATAKDFATYFAQAGLTITSGLALGIDAASHEGALSADGLTVAVCGCGLDEIYPRQHIELAARIREHGAIVSEFPPRTPPLRPYFPQRNRIISGLSLGALVVEAALRSGSLVTARHALEQGREVFAIPGSIHNPLAKGCHKLIRDGAKLVETAADVLTELAIPLREQPLTAGGKAVSRTASRASALDKDYEILLDALAFEPASIDSLAERSGLPGESVASMLLILELDGRVAPHPGGRYGRVHS